MYMELRTSRSQNGHQEVFKGVMRSRTRQLTIVHFVHIGRGRFDLLLLDLSGGRIGHCSIIRTVYIESFGVLLSCHVDVLMARGREEALMIV